MPFIRPLTAALLVLLPVSARAEDPMFPATSGPALSEITEIYVNVSIITTSSGDQRCKVVAPDPGSQVDVFIVHYLEQFGFPKAGLAPWLPEGTPYPRKPTLRLEGTTTLQTVSFKPTCLLAMRAELAFSEPDKPQLVYWSTPILLLEAEAGDDERIPAKDLQDRVRTMGRAIAEQFVKAWIASGGDAEN